MGMPAVPESVSTIEELLALPDDGMRHELLDGEHVVTPSPSWRHQVAIAELFRVLGADLSDREDVQLLSSPADLVLGPLTLVQPDMFVVRREQDRPPSRWADVGVPLLAIEILSPSTASRDRGKKRRLYLDAGVEEYWIVDIDARVVERWRTGDERPEIVDVRLEWALSVGVSGSVDLHALFERIER